MDKLEKVIVSVIIMRVLLICLVIGIIWFSMDYVWRVNKCEFYGKTVSSETYMKGLSCYQVTKHNGINKVF